MDFDFLPMGKPGVEDARAGAVRQSSVSSAGIRLRLESPRPDDSFLAG
jgi:hypothetical protein